MRVAVALGRACDGACVFCAQDGLTAERAPADDVREELTRAREHGADAVTFVGGEPAADERLEELVRYARSLGFGRVGVQTNGRALAAAGRVERLAADGVTDLHLSIHGAEAPVHDWHAGIPGAFDAAMRTLAAARAAGLDVVVATMVTRSSFRVLAPIPRLLASRGVAAFCLEIPRWRGRAAKAADRIVPRLALALPFALHALDAAAAVGLPAFVRGAPSCLLGPFAARAIDEGDGEASRRSFAPLCDACPSRAGCAGVEPEYLARFGASELAPCPAVARDDRDGALAPRLRSMFVGAGELAPPMPAAERSALPPPPERVRVGLPMLGRPLPAHAEVSAAERRQPGAVKTGQALREILPGLFESEPDPPDDL